MKKSFCCNPDSQSSKSIIKVVAGIDVIVVNDVVELDVVVIVESYVVDVNFSAVTSNDSFADSLLDNVENKMMHISVKLMDMLNAFDFPPIILFFGLLFIGLTLSIFNHCWRVNGTFLCVIKH